MRNSSFDSHRAGATAEAAAAPYVYPAVDEIAPAEARERIETEAFRRGRQEAEARAVAETTQALQRERAAIGMVVGAFARARAAYFLRVEGEVVRLALAVARRILHRESQLDPILLRGAVRVALDRLEGSTQVKLRVHPSRAGLWVEAFKGIERTMAPQIVEDAASDPTQCTLETDLGNAGFSVEQQLQEIEQGFFDLLEERIRLTNAEGRGE